MNICLKHTVGGFRMISINFIQNSVMICRNFMIFVVKLLESIFCSCTGSVFSEVSPFMWWIIHLNLERMSPTSRQSGLPLGDDFSSFFFFFNGRNVSPVFSCYMSMGFSIKTSSIFTHIIFMFF